MSTAAVAAAKPPIAFKHGRDDFKNLESDEAIFPVVYLDQPLEKDYILIQNGDIPEGHEPSLLFMYKSELEWKPEKQDSNAIDPANSLIKEFISRCQAHSLLYDIEKARGVEFINLFDVNVSGITLTLKVKTRNTDSVCIP